MLDKINASQMVRFPELFVHIKDFCVLHVYKVEEQLEFEFRQMDFHLTVL